jgi:hypothetical protein
MSWTATVIAALVALLLFYLVGAVALAFLFGGVPIPAFMASVYLVIAVAWPVARARRARRSGAGWRRAIRAAALVSLAMNLVLTPLALLALVM